MAIDTENKRRSALGLASDMFTIYPVPDGSVDTEDRPHAAGFYSGITYSSEVAVTFKGGPLYSPVRTPIDDPIRTPVTDIDQGSNQ